MTLFSREKKLALSQPDHPAHLMAWNDSHLMVLIAGVARSVWSAEVLFRFIREIIDYIHFISFKV